MVFDIKIGDLLTQKARFCGNGMKLILRQNQLLPPWICAIQAVCLFFLAVLNYLNILSANIQNAYLNAPVREHLYTIAGKEFGSANEGRPVLIVCAFYAGLHSSGNCFVRF